MNTHYFHLFYNFLYGEILSIMNVVEIEDVDVIISNLIRRLLWHKIPLPKRLRAVTPNLLWANFKEQVLNMHVSLKCNS